MSNGEICKHCAYSIGLAQVIEKRTHYCEINRYSVKSSDTCGSFLREPGVDDDFDVSQKAGAVE